MLKLGEDRIQAWPIERLREEWHELHAAIGHAGYTELGQLSLALLETYVVLSKESLRRGSQMYLF